MDCLAEVQQSTSGETLDCLGIYPHVLPLSYRWALAEQQGGDGKKYKGDTSNLNEAELIYWGMNLHMYVLVHTVVNNNNNNNNNYYYYCMIWLLVPSPLLVSRVLRNHVV